MRYILLFLVACMKQPHIDHAKARVMLEGDDCLKKLKILMEEAKCPELKYKMLSEYDIMFRCHKSEEQRKTFWDTYIFRLSPSAITYCGKDKEFIESHNICTDDGINTGAYPPSEGEKL